MGLFPPQIIHDHLSARFRIMCTAMGVVRAGGSPIFCSVFVVFFWFAGKARVGDQLLRSSQSTALNIAEGNGKRSPL